MKKWAKDSSAEIYADTRFIICSKVTSNLFKCC